MSDDQERPTVEVEFNADQLEALKALLTLVHYDTLADQWRKMLPRELQPIPIDVILTNLWKEERLNARH